MIWNVSSAVGVAFNAVFLRVVRRSAAVLVLVYLAALTLVVANAEALAYLRVQAATESPPVMVPRHVRNGFETAFMLPEAHVPTPVEMVSLANAALMDRARGGNTRLYCRGDIVAKIARGVRREDRRLVDSAIDRRLVDPRVREAVFQAFLRSARFGGGIVGVDAGSRALFGKNWEELTVDEAFALASVAENGRRQPRTSCEGGATICSTVQRSADC